jgi:hypothetical protein
MHKDDIAAAVERLIAGAEIPAIVPSLIEAVWNGINSVPREERQRMMMTGIMVDLVDPAQTPEQIFALSLRYGLLDALIELGILDDYMQDESSWTRVFAGLPQPPASTHPVV